MNKKRIFIIDAFLLNTGDIGILISIVNSIRKILPEIILEIETSHPLMAKKIKQLDGINIFPRIFDVQFIYQKFSINSRIIILFLNTYDCLSFLVWVLLLRLNINFLYLIRPTRKGQAISMKNADFVISVGGGFLSSNFMYVFRLYILLLFILLNKKIMLFSQSIGPFDTILSKLLIPFFLNKVSVITLREKESYKYLKKYLIKKPFFLTSDMAFLMENIKKEPKKKMISICIRKDNDYAKTIKYKESIIKLIHYLLSKNFFITIISQTIADDSLGIEIKNIFNKHVKFVKFQPNPFVVKKIYGESEFIIASRMHAIIFAAGCNVPFIAISYEPKFKGLLEQLQYDKNFMLSYNEINYNSLLNSVKKLTRNTEYVSTKLRKNVQLQANMAEQNLSIFKDYLNRT
ncbi:MAG: hypothetical protein A2798_01960 [Candidatus Levybacteria bacterium RIFCSPHIGHO2_01_FULL_37_17]|nr:MAG: hypothetical protein A2798_01960 [Candidatus Levybacteria bacterium RIFCSPHIGHO2_01_FULL_37_17]